MWLAFSFHPLRHMNQPVTCGSEKHLRFSSAFTAVRLKYNNRPQVCRRSASRGQREGHPGAKWHVSNYETVRRENSPFSLIYFLAFFFSSVFLLNSHKNCLRWKTSPLSLLWILFPLLSSKIYDHIWKNYNHIWKNKADKLAIKTMPPNLPLFTQDLQNSPLLPVSHPPG